MVPTYSTVFTASGSFQRTSKALTSVFDISGGRLATMCNGDGVLRSRRWEVRHSCLPVTKPEMFECKAGENGQAATREHSCICLRSWKCGWLGELFWGDVSSLSLISANARSVTYWRTRSGWTARTNGRGHTFTALWQLYTVIFSGLGASF